jgi:hypothetical protein
MHTIETLTEYLTDRGLINGSVMSKWPEIQAHFSNSVLEGNEIVIRSEGLKIVNGVGVLIVTEL